MGVEADQSCSNKDPSGRGATGASPVPQLVRFLSGVPRNRTMSRIKRTFTPVFVGYTKNAFAPFRELRAAAIKPE
jgi:hypothetical protein